MEPDDSQVEGSLTLVPEGATRSSMREAKAFLLEPSLVEACLLDAPHDRLFEAAWRGSLSSIDPLRRSGRLAHVTGHVAESVGEMLLVEFGYNVVWHLVGPGTHGVDLIVLCPSGGRLLVVEVKGTLRPKYWPGLSRRSLAQMSAQWLDKADNPGMGEWNLRSDDVFGGVMLINFSEMAFKVALTRDFRRLIPVTDIDQLGALDWLDV